MNPQWRDLISEWEKKYGLVFELDGRMVAAENLEGTNATATPGATATPTARSFAPKAGAQDDTAF